MAVIGISGSYGGLNVGDEAILTSILAELRRVLPDVEPVVFSRDPSHTERHHGVKAVGGRDVLRADIGAEVERLDLLLLGGGGILYDREASSYLQVARIAQHRGVPTATYAIGAGPLERVEERQAVATVLDRMQRITVREVAAKRLLEEIGVEQDVVVTADPALLLEPEPFGEDLLAREGVRKDRTLVAMSVREPGGAAAEIEDARYHALLANAADFIVARFEADVVFVPMERGDIREAHRVMAEMGLPERATVLKGAYSPGEVLGLMDHVDLAVGMRLHFLIFAAKAGVPALALPYAAKVVSFLERLGLPTPQMLHREHVGALLAAIDRLWDRRAEQRALLRERLPAVRELAGTTAGMLAELVEHPPVPAQPL
ncbi:MAG: polysaccharide pyruvyl transferase family protein [Nocardioidaceae bacterium]